MIADRNEELRRFDRTFWILCGVVVALAIALRIGYQCRFEAEIGIDFTRHPELDQNTFHRSARIVTSGDTLSREVYHPYHWWYRAIAPEETFQGWYRAGVFHQSPLYAYFVAAVYAVFGPNPESVHRVQAVLGGLTVLLVALLGRAVLSPSVGLLGAGLFAVYGPAVFYESTLLRAGLVTLLAMGLLVAVACAASPARSGRACLLAGILFGLSILAKPNMLAFLPVAAAYLAFPGRGVPGRDLARKLAALCLGLTLALAPLVARNIAVGASPLAISTRGPYAFVNGNASGSTGVGWFPPETRSVLLNGHAREILNRTRARMLPTVLETLRTHCDAPLGYAGLAARKAGAFFNAYEIPNNVGYHTFQKTIALLRYLPTFWFIGSLGSLGLILALGRRKALILHLFVVTYFAVTILFFVIARFRLPVTPVFALYAAHALERLLQLARMRRWMPLAACGAALAVAAFVMGPGDQVPSRARAAIRIGDSHVGQGRVALEESRRLSGAAARQMANAVDDEMELAAARYEWAAQSENGGAPRDRLEALARLSDLRLRMRHAAGVTAKLRALLREDLAREEQAIAHQTIGSILYQRGSKQAAILEFREAGRLDPKNPVPYIYLADHYFRSGMLDAAVTELNKSIEAEPTFPRGYALLGEVLLAQGKIDAGVDMLGRALQVGIEDPAVEARVRDMISSRKVK